MSDFGYEDENIVRISVLSHPDEETTHLIQRFIEKHSPNSTFKNISVISVNVSTFEWQLSEALTKVLLIQPVGDFTDKLHTRFYQTSGAVILFSQDNQDSFVAAKVFYQNYWKYGDGSSKPIVFIEISNLTDEISINKREKLEEIPNVVYHSLQLNDIRSFQEILGFLVRKCRNT
ncbi:MAG: hypothetical protein JSV04_06300 [Candidatus Heimdallarchaeota archaeon]|nr:MAG: hypothetical protein JSV04_06300 [Candidatus Heimdallarchaeota archaeon]